jgi:ribosomal protein S20
VFYLVMQNALHDGKESIFLRTAIRTFNEMLRENSQTAQLDMSLANYELLTFDRMSVQGTNDAGSIESRTEILYKALKAIDSGDTHNDFPFIKFAKSAADTTSDEEIDF